VSIFPGDRVLGIFCVLRWCFTIIESMMLCRRVGHMKVVYVQIKLDRVLYNIIEMVSVVYYILNLNESTMCFSEIFHIVVSGMHYIDRIVNIVVDVSSCNQGYRTASSWVRQRESRKVGNIIRHPNAWMRSMSSKI
jgi:hypothetical protein